MKTCAKLLIKLNKKSLIICSDDSTKNQNADLLHLQIIIKKEEDEASSDPFHSITILLFCLFYQSKFTFILYSAFLLLLYLNLHLLAKFHLIMLLSFVQHNTCK